MGAKSEGLNRIITAIKKELKTYPTYDLENLLTYAEDLERVKNGTEKRTFQAGNSADWQQFIKEFDLNLHLKKYTTVKSFYNGETNVNSDGTITDEYRIRLNSGEMVYIDISFEKSKVQPI